MDETVQFGYKLPMKEQKEGTMVGSGDEEFLKPFKEALIKAPTEDQESIRPEMMAWARTNSWRKVAEEWSNEFQS